METVVILNNVRSAHNVGSIFRTADGAGVSKLYLCGYTPAPVDRFGRVRPEIEKTSLGATASVPWEAVDDISDVIDRLRNDHFHIVAVEQDARAVSYREWERSRPIAFIFGNEVAGVEQHVRAYADTIIDIPMHGVKESLNIAVTVGVILFHFA